MVQAAVMCVGISQQDVTSPMTTRNLGNEARSRTVIRFLWSRDFTAARL